MSKVLDKLHIDLIEAQKAKNELNVSVLRFLLSAVKNREIELRPSGFEMTDEEVVGVIGKQIKQHNESVVEYGKAGRSDLVERETAEMGVLKSYMPEQMGEDEIKGLVDGAIAESGAKEPKDMGKVMAILMPKVKGKADSSMVSEIVKSKLQAS